MAGTIPTVVYYGIGLLAPTWFYRGDGDHLRGSSDWRSAARGPPPATLGVAFIAHGADPRRRPGDRRRGDHLRRLLRRQDDADLGDDGARPDAGRRGHDQRAHRGDDLDRPGRPSVIAVVAVHDPRSRRRRPAAGVRSDAARRRRWPTRVQHLAVQPAAAGPAGRASRSGRSPPFLAIFGSRALRRHPRARSPSPRPSRPSSTGPSSGRSSTGIEAIYAAMATGFVSTTGNATIDALFSRGGMASMLTTIWLVLGALTLRRDHGACRLPRPADPAGRRPRDARPVA